MHKINYKYGEVIKLNINEVTLVNDTFSIELTYFTHKRPYIGGATKVMTSLTISKDNEYEEIFLSEHGVEGKSKSEDGLSKAERFSSVLWKGYKFQLEKIDYNEYIEIKIFKKE
ncbi:hypothetical protein [Flavivirga algicola]|uniref:Uncharacterized protein n=1 Tax=Flavivirga algicola TaxID=2729136 RepID=A0ABX1RWF4_9FLAO|nr:hypothetical protein [Flavivirga algicola]NMH87088.1 hypothetical protein [Flavivirga algicola]